MKQIELKENLWMTEDDMYAFVSYFFQLSEKTINEMSILNNAGESIPVVAVKLNPGANNVTPTVLQFTVNVPKTGFYNFILRYKVRVQCTLSNNLAVTHYIQ